MEGHQRHVRNGKTLEWSRESPRRAAVSAALEDSEGAASQVTHYSSALEYFLSTSPRPPEARTAIKSLLHTMDHGATKKVSSQLEIFESHIGLPRDTDDDDDAGTGENTTTNNARGSISTVTGSPLGSSSPNMPKSGGVTTLPAIANSPRGGAAAAGRGRGVGAATAASVSSGVLHHERSGTPPAPIPQELVTGKRVPVISSNPVTGILCNVPLYQFFAAYREQFLKGIRARRMSHATMGMSSLNAPMSKKEPLRMTVDDFMDVLRSIVPESAAMISKEYANRMIEPFGQPSPYGGPTRVLFTNVFSYLCKCYGHPRVEKNLKFMFKVLDGKGKGVIPYSVVTGRVIRAWAENRVVGGAIFAWRALAIALEAAGDVDVRLLENPAQITRDELRMILYTTKELTDAVSTSDLECEITTAPRFPTLPSSNGGSGSKASDDASSVRTGGRHHRLL